MPYGYNVPPGAADRLGVFKCYAEVPPQYRLDVHAPAFEGRDVWTEWDDATGGLTTDSEQQRAYLRRVVDSWDGFMEKRGRHPALARPEDVEAWCADLLGRMSARTAYNPYFVTVEKFYEWLAFHADAERYPHVYNPVVMAAAEYPAPDGAAGRVWVEKTTGWRERGGNE